MSVQLRRRIERMERIADALNGETETEEDSGGIRLIPEVLNAVRDQMAGAALIEHTPERLMELRRQSEEWQLRIEDWKRRERILNTGTRRRRQSYA